MNELDQHRLGFMMLLVALLQATISLGVFLAIGMLAAVAWSQDARRQGE